MSNFDAIFKKHLAAGSFHGGSFVAVDKNGNDIYRGSHGTLTTSPDSDPVTPGTITWIASQTKLVTSVAIMQIVEQGLVGLDDDLRELLPVLKGLKVLKGIEGSETGSGDMNAIATGGASVSAVEKPTGAPIYEDIKNPITLRVLLSHASGFAYDLGNPLLMKWSALEGRTVNMFDGTIAGGTHPLVFQPGEDWEYGPGLDWAGHVLEKLTGKDLNTYMIDHIWTPLGAKDSTFHPATHFGAAHPSPPELEMAHRDPATGKLAPGPSPWPRPSREAIGGGGLYSSANDYSKLLACLLRGGAPLLKPESVDELLRPQLSDGSLTGFKRFLNLGMSAIWDIAPVPAGSAAPTDPPPMKIDHCLAGAVCEKDVSGRRAAGTVNWGGLPSLSWFIDRKSGVAATFFTQIMPAGDAEVGKLVRELETEVYKVVRGE